MMPCSSGASSGVTTRARIAFSAIESELYHWNQATPRPAIPIRTARPAPLYEPPAYISPTTSATNSAPSRNITRVIRAVSPRSLMKRVLAISPGSARRR